MIEVIVSPKKDLGVVPIAKSASTATRNMLYAMGWESILLSDYDGDFIVPIRDLESKLRSGIRQCIVNSEIPYNMVKSAAEKGIVLLDNHTLPIFDYLAEYNDKVINHGIFFPFDDINLMTYIFASYGYDVDFSKMRVENKGVTGYDEIVDVYMQSPAFLRNNFNIETDFYVFLKSTINFNAYVWKNMYDRAEVKEYLTDVLFH